LGSQKTNGKKREKKEWNDPEKEGDLYGEGKGGQYRGRGEGLIGAFKGMQERDEEVIGEDPAKD